MYSSIAICIPDTLHPFSISAATISAPEHRLRVSSSVQTSPWAGAKGRIIISVIRKCNGGRLLLYGGAHAKLPFSNAGALGRETVRSCTGMNPKTSRLAEIRGPCMQWACARKCKTCRCCTGGLPEAKSTIHATAWLARRKVYK